MSKQELTRLEALVAASNKRLTQVQAATPLGITTRQIRRLLRAYEVQGASALVSKKRGRPSNHQVSQRLRSEAISLIRGRYPDFGPTFANNIFAKYTASKSLWKRYVTV